MVVGAGGGSAGGEGGGGIDVVVLGAGQCLSLCGFYQWEVEQVEGGGDSTATRWGWSPCCWLFREGSIRVEQTVNESSPVSLVRCLIYPVLERAKAIDGGSGDLSKEEL